MNTQYIWEQSGLSEAIEAIPTATRHTISVHKDFNKPTLMTEVDTHNFHAIVSENQVVGMVSPKYLLVQHREAFEPIQKGLDAMNIPYDFNLFTYRGKSWLSVLVANTIDSVKIGFKAMNSVDGTTALKYSFRVSKSESWIELVGYRQVCENGMVIRVPLDRAEFTKLEVMERVKTLLEENQRIVHMGDKSKEIEAVRYIVEAISLLSGSVAKIIEKAQSREVGAKEAKELIAKYIGKRMAQKIYNRFAYENPSIWGLYNAATNVASHEEIAESTSNGLLLKAATMLQNEI